MITQIIKRDGRKLPFNIEKITNAIYRAAQSVGGTDYNEAQELGIKVCKLTEDTYGNAIPTVEEIQDLVEKVLVEEGHAKTAKAYILYRSNRTRAREMNTRLMKVYEDLTFTSAKDSDIKRDNANIDGDTAMGTMLKYGSEGAKQFYEMYVLDPKHAAAHNNGDIHIHDLDFLTLTTTCCQIDILKLFKGGFFTGHGFLREPKSIQSYASLACIAIQSNQNDQHGGQSIPFFDYGMAPGVAKTYITEICRILDILVEDAPVGEIKKVLNEYREQHGSMLTEDGKAYITSVVKEKLGSAATDKLLDKVFLKAVIATDRAAYQAMEALVHNLNTMHSRAGAQVPFSSINYGTDISEEGRMVIKNLLKSTEAGLGYSETPIFPVQVFKIKEGVNFNPQDPNYDLFRLACQVSAKRLYPNFSFLDAPFNLQYYRPGDYQSEVAYMGCRTRVMANTFDKSRETVSGRGNLSFTSINLPRLGIESHGDVELFFSKLDSMIDLVVEQLLHRFNIQGQKRVRNYPFLMGQGVWIDSDKLGPDDEVREILKHGTLSCGFIGLAECLKSLIGEHHGQSEKAQELGLRIIGHMRDRMDEESKNTGLNFSLLATPGEGLSGRFVRMDKVKYGPMEGITDRDYYTNSFHVPVYHDITAFEKIKLEAPYHTFTNAGHISYIEMDGDPLQNVDAFERIVRYMKESGVGYGSINHPVDRDPVCGFTGIIGDVCPCCGRKENEGPSFERIRRITGYLVGTLERFNNAKRAEERDRIHHGMTIHTGRENGSTEA